MVKCLLPLILVAVTGCASASPLGDLARPFEVQVPVETPIFCKPPTLALPALPIAGLHNGSSAAETVRSYAATVVILKGAVRERDAALAGCAAPPAEPPARTGSAAAAPTALLVGPVEN